MIAENPAWERSAKGRLFYRSREHQIAQFEEVAKHLPRGGKRNLLDVGCGYGDFTQFLPSGYGYEGIDADPDVIESAQRLYPGYHFCCSQKIVNANVIVCIAAMQNMLVDPRDLAERMVAHCKLLIVSTVNERFTPTHWDQKMVDLFPDAKTVVDTEDDFVVIVTEGTL